MSPRHRVRGGASRIVLVSVIAIAATATLALPATAQRHSVRRTDGDTSYSMSWSGSSLTPFQKPTSAPGLRMPSVDGKLLACRTGRARAASGFDILYKTLGGGAKGTWGGPGDQIQPAVSDGLIAGVDHRAIAVFDPATHTATTVSDAAAVPLSPAFSGGVVVWQDHRGADWDIYARRVDPATGAPSGDVFAVCTAAGDQTGPAVDGDTVVWQDRRGADWDIYSFDLATLQESPVCTSAGDQTHPDVAMDLVVWQDHRRGQWDIWSRDLVKEVTKVLCGERGAQTLPAASADLVVWQDRHLRVIHYGTATGETVRRFHTPVIMSYSRAAGEQLSEVMGPYAGAAQTRPDVNGWLTVWEDTSGALPRGATRIYGGATEDLWAYGYSISPGDPYVNTPDVTFHLHVDVCPNPPVAQMSLVVGRRAWDAAPVWEPFRPDPTVHLSGADGAVKYELSFRDSAGDDGGSEGSVLILDTHGPSCWTPYPLVARAGGSATLRYKVTDKQSGWATATVEILREDGTVVRTLKPRFVRTGEFVQRPLLCDLDPGTYTVRVTATDEAGNEQARIGTTTLTVK
jgi:beta propeller repeat protein